MKAVRLTPVPYYFSTGRWYRLRIWRLNDTSNGRWWGGWVIDDAGNQSYIGSLLAPRGDDLITGTVSFNEYFGTSVGYPCGRLPPSTVYFYQPILNADRSRATIDSSRVAVHGCRAGRERREPTAHSGRVGRRGASTTDVMLAGNWKTSRMVAPTLPEPQPSAVP